MGVLQARTLQWVAISSSTICSVLHTGDTEQLLVPWKRKTSKEVAKHRLDQKLQGQGTCSLYPLCLVFTEKNKRTIFESYN